MTDPIVFPNDGSEWSAMHAAERHIREQGWSVGPTDITGRRGVVFQPDVRVAKWKNLTPAEQAACDAVLVGRSRNENLTLTFRRQ